MTFAIICLTFLASFLPGFTNYQLEAGKSVLGNHISQVISTDENNRPKVNPIPAHQEKKSEPEVKGFEVENKMQLTPTPIITPLPTPANETPLSPNPEPTVTVSPLPTREPPFPIDLPCPPFPIYEQKKGNINYPERAPIICLDDSF